jgi:hypothetical protein
MTRTGHCNCCDATVTLLTDANLGESVCSVCRSYDVVRVVRLTREELRKQRLHEMAELFMDAFEARA